MAEFRAKLGRVLEEESIKTDEIMASHTTFRIGGPADYYVTPKTAEELAAVIQLCRQEQMPYYVVGNGSNLLVSDKGYRGVIIAMTDSLGACTIEGTTVTAGAGIRLYRLAKQIGEASLTGFEFAAGIPGTLGGALVMNAGAYGSEMKNILTSAKVLDPEGRILTLTAEELDLSYRHSCIPEKGYTVLEGTFQLAQGEAARIRETMEDLSRRRREKQPLDYPSAGSTFKRPEGNFAGKLIEEAGLRGFTVGGAQVAEKHCGFVVNKNHATAGDVRTLCREVAKRVKEHSGVDLEMEVKILGED